MLMTCTVWSVNAQAARVEAQGGHSDGATDRGGGPSASGHAQAYSRSGRSVASRRMAAQPSCNPSICMRSGRVQKSLGGFDEQVTRKEVSTIPFHPVKVATRIICCQYVDVSYLALSHSIFREPRSDVVEGGYASNVIARWKQG